MNRIRVFLHLFALASVANTLVLSKDVPEVIVLKILSPAKSAPLTRGAVCQAFYIALKL